MSARCCSLPTIRRCAFLTAVDDADSGDTTAAIGIVTVPYR